MRISRIVLCALCALVWSSVPFRGPWAAEGHGHEGHAHEKNELDVGGESQALIGLKTEPARLSVFTNKIAVSGRVAQDPVASSYITPPVSGVITACRVRMGSVVQKGEVLCVVQGAGRSTEITAPIAGVVISDSFKTGETVDSVSSMHTIADLSQVWAVFDVYEKDVAAVCVGQKIAVRSAAYPDAQFPGEVTFVSPCVDAETHTIKVRALVGNTDYRLKLGMFVTADILVEAPGRYVVVPLEAVHVSGDDRIVFIKEGETTFEARKVTVYGQTATEAAICAGICEGEAVVVGNSFLLKSEYLKSKMSAGCAD